MPRETDAATGGESGQSASQLPQRRRSRPWLRAALIFAVGYLLLVTIMAWFQDTFIFFPSKYPDGDWEPIGLEFEDAWFEAEDGSKLHGWYVPAKNPRAVVLFAHGNAGNLTHRIDTLEALANRLGASVLIFDYRGYGRSGGSPSTTGILADARAARRWLASRAEISESQIVLMGESIGGAVAIHLAAEDGARGLIVENVFSSLADVGAHHYPFLPVNLVMRGDLNNVSQIGKYHGPLLQFHGDADSIVPFELGQKVFAAASEPKRFVVIAGGDHNDPRSGTAYRELDRFLAALPPVE
jgi:fermentation-respiration switch protein FrsA (DUF1100 family)